MDVYDEDLLRFWEYLSKYNFRYIMVGGFATYFNGFERTTKQQSMLRPGTYVNRPKDQIDVIELEKIKKMRDLSKR